MAYYFPTDFDLNSLMQTFKKYCKDFNGPLEKNKKSQAMEFATKINVMDKDDLKAITKEDKSISFNFPDISQGDSPTKKVIVTSVYSKTIENGDKLILPYKQARLLAVMIFSNYIEIQNVSSDPLLMTPMCRSIFSLTTKSITEMAQQMRIQVVNLLQILHESTIAGGEHLPNSDMSCAIVAMLNTTKCKDEAKKNEMVVRLKKQYNLRNKQYSSENFAIFTSYVNPRVPKGLDPESLIRKFNEIQDNLAQRLQAQFNQLQKDDMDIPEQASDRTQQ